ncbi:MAG: L-2-hydroxyglutarate oxidase [Magnetococcales bacterium]|nr:L-2-hydroxyglutarate oxidase [Magnetococcales bacterium]
MTTTPDYLIAGGGVVGVTTALTLKQRYPDASVILMEKESACGQHASGRNSGVLHAGFYYTADSLKARFTRIGNQRMTAYCKEKGLAINECGKLVVAKNQEELETLETLKQRGEANGIDIQEITVAEAREMEPRVRTHERALFSPTTSSVNPAQIMASLEKEAVALGVEVRTGVHCQGRVHGGRVRTDDGDMTPGYFINASGLQADQIARTFGFSEKYRILPFKGLYLYEDAPQPVRMHIYPVPDLRNPFLGVHYTVTVDHKTKLGPTAIPCFWREQYGGMDGFDFNEFLGMAWRQANLVLFSNFAFKRLAIEESRKYSRRVMASMAGVIATDSRPENCRVWAKPGIRAQLVETARNALVNDFVIEGDHKSLHVLNAVSPAFTCSFPFAEHIVDEIERLRA